MENNHGHTHQVLHVSFAHNGEMFATCSKDGYVIVRPYRIRKEYIDTNLILAGMERYAPVY